MRMSWKVQNVIKSKEKGNMRHKTSATQQYREDQRMKLRESAKNDKKIKGRK